MHRLLVALGLLAFVPGTAAAQDKEAVVAAVKQFVDSFNKGDTKTAAAACADETSIIDEFPPYEWHGAGACAKWMDEYVADAEKNGITDGVVTLGTPKHIDIMADRAYVVVPANYAFKQKGKPIDEAGSSLTVTLQEGAGGWRITGWTWTRG